MSRGTIRSGKSIYTSSSSATHGKLNVVASIGDAPSIESELGCYFVGLKIKFGAQLLDHQEEIVAGKPMFYSAIAALSLIEVHDASVSLIDRRAPRYRVTNSMDQHLS